MNTQSAINILFWGALSLLFSLFIISGDWPLVAGLPVAIALVVLALSRPKILAIIWIVGIPTVFIYANNFLQGIPFLRVERAILVIFFVLFLITMVFDRDSLKSLIPLEKIMLVLLLIVGVSLAVGAVGEPWLEVKETLVLYLKGFFVPYMAFFIARRLDWSQSDVMLLIKWLLVAAVYLAVAGFLEYYFGMDFFYPEYREPPIPDRAGASFYQPAHYGLVMGTFFFLALFMYVREKDQAIRAGLLMIALVIIVGIALCMTRGPWIATLLGLGYIYMKDKRIRGICIAGAIVGMFGLLIAIPYLLQSGVLEDRLLTVQTLYPRFANFATSLNMIAHNPIFGVGFGIHSFADAKPEFATTFGMIPIQWTIFAGIPHNEYLHMLVLTGLVGFIPFIAILYWLFRLTSVQRLAARGAPVWCQELAIYLRATAIAYVVAGLVVDTLQFRYLLMLMFFMLGVLVSGVEQHARSKGSNTAESNVGAAVQL